MRSDGLDAGETRAQQYREHYVLDGFLIRELSSSNIEVIRNFDDGLQPLVTDAMQFEQVFVNIVNNALDAMQGGSGTHRGNLTGRQVPARGRLGYGYPGWMTIRSPYLQPFFTTKEVGKGTGLGLSVTWYRGQPGGEVVESAGHGSAFTISLPKDRQLNRRSVGQLQIRGGWITHVREEGEGHHAAAQSECAVVADEATLAEAIIALDEAQELVPAGRQEHRVVLVQDAKGRIGYLGFLKALEPKYSNIGDVEKLSRVGVGAF